MGPVPPGQGQHPFGHRFGKAAAQGGGGYTGHDHVGGDIAGHDRAGGNHGPCPHGHLGADDRAMPHPGIRPQHRAARGAAGEEVGVIGGIVEVIRRPVQEVVQAGVVHRVVRRADPGKGCDIGELADRGVGHIREAVAVGIGQELGIDDARACPHLGPGAEGGIGGGGPFMEQGLGRREFGHGRGWSFRPCLTVGRQAGSIFSML